MKEFILFDDIEILSRKLDRLITTVERLTQVCEQLDNNITRATELLERQVADTDEKQYGDRASPLFIKGSK